ncbi:MAG TPA: UDP-N-acetylmuramoyl-L-alanyl-D-glutamate--2,6-diaminopimelate ligase [Polyangiales bacterium]
MAELALQELVRSGIARRIDGDASVKVRGVRHDSRNVEPGDLFVAIAGAGSDGATFAEAAIARGAVAVLSQRPLPLRVPVAVADDGLVSLARVATLLYDDPTRQLGVVGITGTNGKTTTAYLLESVLQAAGGKPAVIGTVSFRGPGGVRQATHTTPMADDLMRLSRWAVDTGATHLLLEVSSHGLAQHRVDGVRFAVAAFTNLTQDHLDFHGSMAEYEQAKRRLFTELAPDTSVVNIDDAAGASIARSVRGKLLRCSRHASDEAEVRVLQWVSDRQGIRADVATPAGRLALHSPLIGEHNLENLLVAVGCAHALGIAPALIASGLASAVGAPGRLERVAHPQDVLVFVDYAHTPDALSRVLRAVRKTTPGRVIVAFGCGGNRDAGKRPLMGRAAAELADLVVLTSDNPRNEVPEAIVAQIEAGVSASSLAHCEPEAFVRSERGYAVQVDRRAAIRLALRAARAGDSVVLAGKGHETVQIIGSQQLPFDDRVEARAAIAEVGGA